MFSYLGHIFTYLPVILLACVTMNKQLAAQSIFESCSKDIESYCSQVTPGNGRLSACLYSYEDKISDECDAATEDLSNLLDWFLETVRYTMDQCADDIQTYCAGTEFGGGRILSCLANKSSQVADGCREAVSLHGKLLE